MPYSPFDDMPEGLKQFSDWTPVEVDGERILVISDLHIPYYDKKATWLALKFGKDNNIDTLFINGDWFDFYGLSQFEKDPRKVRWSEELDFGKKLLNIIQRVFPKIRIYYKLGNHEERYERYMKIKAPELLGMKEYEMEHLLTASDRNMTVIKDKRIAKVGHLNIIHGHEFGSGGGVNPSRSMFLKGNECCLVGHYHRTSEYSDVTMNDKLIACWSTGCLCDLKPDWMPLNKWNLGFAYIERKGDMGFTVTNKKIINYKIY